MAPKKTEHFEEQSDLEVMISDTVEWFKTAGIPVLHTRVKRSTTRWRSASNATKEQLQADYNWTFEHSEDGVQKQGTKDILDAILKSTDLLGGKGPQLVISIPQDWWVPDEKMDEHMHTLGLRAWAVLSKPLIAAQLTPLIFQYNQTVKAAKGVELFLREGGTVAKAQPPHEIIAMSDIYSEQQLTRSFLALKTLMASLDMDTMRSIGSELSLERRLGWLLPGFFTFQNCALIEGSSLEYPVALGCWASAPRPDLASRTKNFGRNQPSKHGPVILVAECKKAANTSVEAQLACAVQPTLQLFAAHLVNKYRNDDRSWSSEWNPLDTLRPPQIPEWMHIYAIQYDEDGFTFYAFFPRYQIVTKSQEVKWRFACRKLSFSTSEDISKVFKHQDLMPRAALLKTLIVLRRSALRTASEMDKLELPECIEVLEAKWIQFTRKDNKKLKPVEEDTEVLVSPE